MDLQLTEEQGWLAQAVDELLDRADAGAVWGKLVEFGAFEIGAEGLGAVELALVSRAIGARLVAAPYADAAAVHYVLGLGDGAIVACLSEPGRPYLPAEPAHLPVGPCDGS